VFVYGFKHSSKEEIALLFEEFGKISQISKKTKQTCITFESKGSAEKALASTITYNKKKVNN
jgi:hypothetical protein